ncbi:MAG: DUF4412 domain-containing protein [Phaeodactylibacter sp.]|nr:DUF4412 domain-containing protein [Phaeodactylibacter sp.]
MKNPKYLVVYALLGLFVLSAQGLQAQVTDKAEDYANQAKRKTERRIDRSVDNAIDKGLDKIFNKNKNKKKEAETNEPPVTDADVYATDAEPSTYKLEEVADVTSNDFTGSFKMAVTTQKGGSVDEASSGEMHYYFMPTQSATQVEQGGEAITVVYDLQQKSMTTIKKKPGGNKVAVILNRPSTQKLALSSNEIKVSRLASTRTIQGKKCTKYIVEAPNDYVTLWVAEEVHCNFDLLMRSVNAASKEHLQKVTTGYGIYGLPMKITVESTTRDEVVEMDVTDLIQGTPDANVFNTDGADVTDLRNF